jgi:hypothetical protein
MEYNTKDGMARSESIFNVIEVLLKQNKTFIEGVITHKDSNTTWHYNIRKEKPKV